MRKQTWRDYMASRGRTAGGRQRRPQTQGPPTCSSMLFCHFHAVFLYGATLIMCIIIQISWPIYFFLKQFWIFIKTPPCVAY